MAAALAGFNNYLQNTLLIGTTGVRTALNDQGLQSFDNLSTLTEDDIAEVCSNTRKPGGTVPNPAYVTPTAAAPAVPGVPGVPVEIPNPGVRIGHVYEKRLKMVWFFVYHFTQIQRPFNPPTATLARLNVLYLFHQQEEEHNNEIPLPDKLSSVDNIHVMIEDLDDYFQ